MLHDFWVQSIWLSTLFFGDLSQSLCSSDHNAWLSTLSFGDLSRLGYSRGLFFALLFTIALLCQIGETSTSSLLNVGYFQDYLFSLSTLSFALLFTIALLCQTSTSIGATFLRNWLSNVVSSTTTYLRGDVYSQSTVGLTRFTVGLKRFSFFLSSRDGVYS